MTGYDSVLDPIHDFLRHDRQEQGVASRFEGSMKMKIHDRFKRIPKRMYHGKLDFDAVTL